MLVAQVNSGGSPGTAIGSTTMFSATSTPHLLRSVSSPIFKKRVRWRSITGPINARSRPPRRRKRSMPSSSTGAKARHAPPMISAWHASAPAESPSLFMVVTRKLSLLTWFAMVL